MSKKTAPDLDALCGELQKIIDAFDMKDRTTRKNLAAALVNAGLTIAKTDHGEGGAIMWVLSAAMEDGVD